MIKASGVFKEEGILFIFPMGFSVIPYRFPKVS